MQKPVKKNITTSCFTEVLVVLGEFKFMEDVMGTLPALLERNSKLYGQKEAFREKQFGIWQTWSWTEVYEEVNKLSLGLISLGVKEGDHICVIGRNRPQLYWSILDLQ